MGSPLNAVAVAVLGGADSAEVDTSAVLEEVDTAVVGMSVVLEEVDTAVVGMSAVALAVSVYARWVDPASGAVAAADV